MVQTEATSDCKCTAGAGVGGQETTREERDHKDEDSKRAAAVIISIAFKDKGSLKSLVLDSLSSLLNRRTPHTAQLDCSSIHS